MYLLVYLLGQNRTILIRLKYQTLSVLFGTSLEWSSVGFDTGFGASVSFLGWCDKASGEALSLASAGVGQSLWAGELIISTPEREKKHFNF